jgi:hypothetical protein
MSEVEYMAGVKLVGKRLGVDNPFDHAEFLADVARLEPHMAVKSLSRRTRVQLMDRSRTPHKGRITRFGRASFTKVY